MNKEKIASLTKYIAKQKDLLTNPSTPSQATKEFKAFLEKDIKMATAKLEAAKMAGTPTK